MNYDTFRQVADTGPQQDDRLRIEFYEGFEHDTLKSKGYEELNRAGEPTFHPGTGTPEFKPVDFIRIFTPGDQRTVIDRPMTDCGFAQCVGSAGTGCDKHRFARKYRDWKEGKGTEGGFPLDQWAAVTRSQVETLRYHQVRTVEQLANVIDGNLGNLGAGYLDLRQKARDYLAAKKDEGQVFKMRSELEARDAQIADLARVVKELQERQVAQAKTK